MQNKALENTVFVCAAGAFGVFLRWMQLQLAFDEQGLCGPSVFNVLVPLFIVVAAWVLRKRVKELLDKRYVLPTAMHEALSNHGKLYAFFRWAAGAVMALGGTLMIRGSETEKFTLMLRIMGGLAILTGICVPLFLGMANKPAEGKKLHLLCALCLVPLALFALWLIYDYRANAINSVLWGFVVEVLAASVLLVAFFRLAGFAYGVVEPKKILFWLQFGVFMSLTVLADSRDMSGQLIFFSAGMMLALADFILICRLREKEEEPLPPPSHGGFDKL